MKFGFVAKHRGAWPVNLIPRQEHLRPDCALARNWS